ncbi:hypothetical protein MAWWA_24 [Bacillus phage vB_BspH_Mawwa]|nr:hypothetical protein MAWWA_24 [Bacillus phage vB_BspH_Mawwa]
MKYTNDTDIKNITKAQEERDGLLTSLQYARLTSYESLKKRLILDVLDRIVYELYEDRIKEEKKNKRREQINQDLEDAMDLEWGSGYGDF